MCNGAGSSIAGCIDKMSSDHVSLWHVADTVVGGMERNGKKTFHHGARSR